MVADPQCASTALICRSHVFKGMRYDSRSVRIAISSTVYNAFAPCVDACPTDNAFEVREQESIVQHEDNVELNVQ